MFAIFTEHAQRFFFCLQTQVTHISSGTFIASISPNIFKLPPLLDQICLQQ